MAPGKPGTPRYQRFLNRCFLLELEEEVTGSRSEGEDGENYLSPTDVFRLAAKDCIVEPESSFFTDVINDEEARQRWAPFLSCSEESQESMLVAMGARSCPRDVNESPVSRVGIVLPKYQDALRRCRKNAGLFDFLCRLEVIITHYMHLMSHTLREPQVLIDLTATARFVDDGDVSPFGERLVFEGPLRFPMLEVALETSYHRLLCHSLCSYYRLVSESVGLEEARVTQIRLGKPLDRLRPDWQPDMPAHSMAVRLVK